MKVRGCDDIDGICWQGGKLLNNAKLSFVVAFASVRTSGLPVSEASDGGGGAGPPEFPGNILEGHGEGRVPGRVGPDTSEDSQPGSCDLLSLCTHHHIIIIADCCELIYGRPM